MQTRTPEEGSLPLWDAYIHGFSYAAVFVGSIVLYRLVNDIYTRLVVEKELYPGNYDPVRGVNPARPLGR